MAVTTIIKDRDYVDCAVGITVGTIFLVLSFIFRCLKISCVTSPLSFNSTIVSDYPVIIVILNMCDNCQPCSGQTSIHSPTGSLPDSQVLP